MVGKFSLGNKASPSRQQHTDIAGSPPPPYRENGHGRGHENHFAAEMTTTTTHIVTTTTQTTTTHFFSLPLWRRRAPTASSTTASRAPRLSSNELGVIRPTTSANASLMDKELPPTPSNEEDTRRSTQLATGSVRQHDSGTAEVGKRSDADIGRTSVSSSFPALFRSSPSPGESSSQSTVALARAALGIGLPHVMPGSVSASSSTSDVNTLTLMPHPVPAHAEPRTSQSSMRRAKSFQKGPDASGDENVSPAAIMEHRRARGLSLGPLQFASSEKGKEKQREPEIDPAQSAPAPKALTRKSSFWSRRRVDSHAPPPISYLAVDPSPRPSLPSLQPISPFYMDTPVPPPPTDASGPSHQPSDLRRRHSERTRSFTNLRSEYFEVMSPPEVPPLPPSTPRPSRFSRPKRPKTADSATSHRRSSFFPDVPRVITSSPPQVVHDLSQQEEPIPQPPSPRVIQANPTARPRSQTNPPLLHRLSMNLFGSSPTTSSPHVIPSPLYDPITGPDQLSASPSSSYDSSRLSLTKRSVEIPRPRAEEESPEVYLQRLTEAVSKAEVATVLASNADPFHARALRAYIDHFDFFADPLDVAVRKLLMDVGLPRETQQIDRVIEAFAARYVQCNPNLFTSDDHPYILAFSLIMLHTDAFNKSNKRKMTKPDYVKNTRLPGVAPEVLDCFYDNIVFAPFIFIEDPLDVNGQRGLVPDARRMSTFNMPTTPGSTTTLLGKSNKIDPYYLIARNLLDDLRVNVNSLVPPESPYVYQGTGGPWDEEELLRAFIMAGNVDIAAENRYPSAPWFGMGVAGGPGPLFQNSMGAVATLPPFSVYHSIKVTKVGVLLRKDDTLEGGRRALNRKWREWCVLLTGSQLVFFRDASWARAIEGHIAPSNGHVLSRAALPQPDEYISVKDAIAVFDKSYTKHPHTLRLVMPDGRLYLLQSSEENEMNEWISRINYASAFKTAGVRMRALGMNQRDIELTGIAAAASHMREIQHRATSASSPRVRTWYGGSPGDLDMSTTDLSASPNGLLAPPASAPARQASIASTVVDSPKSQMESSARLFKATFDEVKTELAASGRWSSEEPTGRPIIRPRTQSLESASRSPPTSPMSPLSDTSDASRGSSRSEIIRRKLLELDTRLARAQTQLDADLRLVRNLAVLTPFQRATRDRVQGAVQGAAKRVMQVRLELEKLGCYRDVLSDDLRAEERDWARTKRIAMRAATDKLALQGQRAPILQVEVTEPFLLDGADGLLAASPSVMSTSSTARTSVSSQERDTSLGEESFHSAVSSADWHDLSDLSPESASIRDSREVHDAYLLESPRTSPLPDMAAGRREYPFPDVSGRAQASALSAEPSMESAGSSGSHAGAGHEKFVTAPEPLEEQAEEWNKTRAAKRVSLVRLPPDLRIAVLFGKHGRTGSESISEDTGMGQRSSPERGRGGLGGSGGDASAYGRATETFAMLDV